MKSFKKQLFSEIRRQQLQKMNRAKELVKLLERLIKQDHLYSDERIKEMKVQLSSLKTQIMEMEKQNSKGFGKK